MIEYLRRYLADPENPTWINSPVPINPGDDVANEMNIYLRRYLADI